ncbi:hypothetical protein FACS1894176_06400 [Bacteroidia bacterium]|nr:hypothetical protein FACS1894176_06400 [Bacteroidia bacterium]
MPKSPIQFYDNVNLPTTEREKIFKDQFTPGERVVIKIHFGEPGNKTAFTPKIIAPFIQSLHNLGFETVLRDAPVFYGGPRATKQGYEKVVAEKGFTKLTNCEICDEYDTMPLHDGESAEVATLLTNAKNLLVLTHVKGHPAAGFGATIKNI